MKKQLSTALTTLGVGVSLAGASHAAGTWTPLTNSPGSGVAIDFPLLLTDGTVMCGDGWQNWYRLTPDIHGSYINGTWSQLAPMKDTRLFNSGQVLNDGRVYQAGGEYGSGANTSEVYNPLTNSWSYTAPGNLPSGGYADAESKMLPGGKVLQSDRFSGTGVYNPASNTWSNVQQSPHNMDEMTWITLPDDTVLTCWDWSHRYSPTSNTWIADTTSPVLLADAHAEIGPGFLLPNGKAFFVGGAAVTATYTPTGNNNPGTWTSSTIPNNLSCPDAPGVMMPNGKIMCVMTDETGVFNGGASTYAEYDYTNNSWTMVNGPKGANSDSTTYYRTGFLTLPDGNVLYLPGKSNNDGYAPAYVYQPAGAQISTGRPVITSITPNADNSYHMTGTGLTGMSTGATYGDDKQMATNYPIVKLTASNGNVYYARTYNWSSNSLQTGNRVITTEFTVPAGVPSGAYSAVVSASGLMSAPVTFNYGAIANGTYTLTPQCATGSRLDAAAGGTTNGTKCEIWTAGSGANQKWTFTKQADGSYEITASYASTMCLDANGTANGSLVSLWTYHNTNNEHWLLTTVSGNIYRLSPESVPGSALDVAAGNPADGTQVLIWPYGGGSNQQWAIN